MPTRAVGIDLGTTYSAVAWVADAGRTAMIANAEGDILTPSVVLFEDAGTLVGKAAR
jgi:molecular chaperone DnaK